MPVVEVEVVAFESVLCAGLNGCIMLVYALGDADGCLAALNGGGMPAGKTLEEEVRLLMWKPPAAWRGAGKCASGTICVMDALGETLTLGSGRGFRCGIECIGL